VRNPVNFRPLKPAKFGKKGLIERGPAGEETVNKDELKKKYVSGEGLLGESCAGPAYGEGRGSQKTNQGRCLS